MRPLSTILLLLLMFLSSPGLCEEILQETAQTKVSEKPNDSDQADNGSKPSPVIFKRDTLFFIYAGAEDYPANFRANQIAARLNLLSDQFNTNKDTVYLVTKEEFAKVMYNDEIAFIITKKEAQLQNIPLEALAETRKNQFAKALESQKKQQLSTKQWLIRIGYFLLSLLALITLLKLINWLFRKLNTHLSKFERTFLKKKKNVLKYFIPKNTTNIFVFISNVTRVSTIIVLLFTLLPFVFSFFPITEDIVSKFYGYIARPIRYVFYGFIDFLPNLVFIIVIVIITRYIIRVQRDIVEDIENERFIIKGFPKDWANTTQKLISLFIWAFSIVLIYPHLPGSTSPAFKGVSIFIGALISFGSTTAVANIVAGVVITYMRPYQIGDRVKIQNTMGDVIERTLLVTRIRTTKNEDVTIPNANIINSHLINYSANAEKSGLIIHTSITIGYDVPWTRVEELLLGAAKKSDLVETDPVPFVLQTSLDDNYVSYELNAYTKEIRILPRVYSDIHKHILDEFNKAGVEILSPKYIAARDGNLSTVPSKIKVDSKSPIDKIVDHLTGRNQAIKTTSTRDGAHQAGHEKK